MTDIEKLLLEMLEIPSVSGEEKDMGDFLVSKLGDFKIKKQLIGKSRFNVIAEKGIPEIYLVVHMDTVPGDVPVKVTTDRIYGRGAIDNKGNIAGAIMAARKLENIGLIFTVGEEDDFSGAKKVVIKKGKFIIMEPTKMEVMSGQRGIIAFNIIASGVQMHSSLDFSNDKSAIYNLVKTLADFYKKKWTSFNVVITSGGEKENIVSDYAMAQASVRPKSISEYNEVIVFLKKIKEKNISIKIRDSIRPCSSDLVKSGKTAPFFSEMAFFKNSILFGVGDISNAHTANEYVLRKDLNKLEEKLINLINII